MNGLAFLLVACMVLVVAVAFAADRLAIRTRRQPVIAIARVVHELRTPLAVARLVAELNEYDHEFAAEAAHDGPRGVTAVRPHASRVVMTDLTRELDRATKLLDEISDICEHGGERRAFATKRLNGFAAWRLLVARAAIGRSSAPQVRGDLFDPRKAAVEIVQCFRTLAATDGRRVWLRWSAGEIRVAGDRLDFEAALGNLVSNALRHGRGTIVIDARVKGGDLICAVCDQGAGLPAPVGKLIAAEGTGRHGHGLAIAQASARRLAGRLTSGVGTPCAPRRYRRRLGNAKIEIVVPLARS